VDQRGNAVGKLVDGERHLIFNMDPRPVVDSKVGKVARRGGSKRNVDVESRTEDGSVEFKFRVPFGDDPKFVRGVAKVAFSLFAQMHGLVAACDPRFNWLRAFVREGAGRFGVLLLPTNDQELLYQWGPVYEDKSGGYAIGFRLLCIECIVDLSEGQPALPRMVEQAKATLGENGFGLLSVEV